MVLGAKLNHYGVLALFFFCISCNATSNITDTAIFNQHSFALSTLNNQCILEHTNTNNETVKKIPLALTPPCHFTRKSDNTALYYPYDDVEISATLIIVGNPISPEIRKEWGLDNNVICGEKAQGLLIYKNEMRLSKKTLDGGVMCPYKGLDEKDFWYLAH